MHKLKGSINGTGQAGRIWGSICTIHVDLADCSTFLRHLIFKREVHLRRLSNLKFFSNVV
jgi:hypothetical protein